MPDSYEVIVRRDRGDEPVRVALLVSTVRKARQAADDIARSYGRAGVPVVLTDYTLPRDVPRRRGRNVVFSPAGDPSTPDYLGVDIARRHVYVDPDMVANNVWNQVGAPDVLARSLGAGTGAGHGDG